MAKFVGFVGTISGKVGTTVFSKGEKGLSYGRSYQPQVYNPKTTGQVDQRAKMNLVGRMSQVTPKALLTGMLGENNRQRRSAFNSGLLAVATIDRSVPSKVVAQIAPEDVVFSEGGEQFHATAAAPTITASQVSIAITLADSALAGSYGERIVVAVIDPSAKAGYSQVYFTDSVLDNTTAKTINIGLPVELVDGSLVSVYRIPFVLNSEGVLYRTETLSNNGTDIIADMLASSANYVRGFGRSVFETKQVFTQA